MVDVIMRCNKCRKNFLTITAKSVNELMENMAVIIKTNGNLDVCAECQEKEEKNNE